ncbi:N-acetylmuramoyl-L-alanine amidase [Brachybacterium sp. GPGPB12]|uniref:N-acetylmuramoyl-L-alanine amidase n=1 Tax=Brachybacterium sp. GPGPB12 TaxID=3023517 RepID=UPI003134589E
MAGVPFLILRSDPTMTRHPSSSSSHPALPAPSAPVLGRRGGDAPPAGSSLGRRSLFAGSALAGAAMLATGVARAEGEPDPDGAHEDQPPAQGGTGRRAAEPRTTTIAPREAELVERDGRQVRRVVGHPAALVGITWDEGDVEPAVSARGLQVDGAWSPWHELEVAVDLDTGVRSAGTEPVFFADVTEVEVIGELDGADATEGLYVHLIDFPEDPKQAPMALDEGGIPADDVARERDGEEVASASAEPTAPQETPQRRAEETAATEETGEDERPGSAPAPSDGGGAGPSDGGGAYPSDGGGGEPSDTGGAGGGVGGAGVQGAAVPARGPFQPMALAPKELGIPGAPPMITRAQWGATESATRSTSTSSALKSVVPHHTAGTNNYSRSQAAQQIRGIFDYHVRVLGWADIGYNVLVDRYGQIYEGRHGGLTRNVNGAHALGFNTGAFGISVMGDHSSLKASTEAREAVMRVAAWKPLSTFLDDVKAKSSWTVGVDGTRWKRGTTVSLPRFFGHRDVNTTSCPGDALYSAMDDLRWGIQTRIDSGWRFHLRAFADHGGASTLGTVLTSAQKEGDHTITRLSEGLIVSGPGLSARAATTTDSIRRAGGRPGAGRWRTTSAPVIATRAASTRGWRCGRTGATASSPPTSLTSPSPTSTSWRFTTCASRGSSPAGRGGSSGSRTRPRATRRSPTCTGSWDRRASRRPRAPRSPTSPRGTRSTARSRGRIRRGSSSLSRTATSVRRPRCVVTSSPASCTAGPGARSGRRRGPTSSRTCRRARRTRPKSPGWRTPASPPAGVAPSSPAIR